MHEDNDKKTKRVKFEVVEEPEDESVEIHKDKLNDEHHDEIDEHENNKIHDHIDSDEVESNNYEEKSIQPVSDKLPIWILFLCFLIGLILGAGLIGGIFYYRAHIPLDKIADKIENPINTPESTPEESTPSPSPESKTDFSKITVQILNGSGIKGEAGRVEGLINDLEFNDILLGNAGSYDFKETIISSKENTPSEVYDQLTKALSSYVTKKGDTLKASSNYDVVITVGSQKK